MPVDEYKDVIRVACVGDSITFGAGVGDREKNSYPAVLGRLLGEKWQVKNFGVSGATMLNKGDKPYTKQKAFAAALEFKPNVVLIKLGTNDSKPQNWKFKADFAADAKRWPESSRRLIPRSASTFACPCRRIRATGESATRSSMKRSSPSSATWLRIPRPP